MAIKPITGMIKKNLFVTLSSGLAFGFVMGNAYWFGYHMPRTNGRDNFYKKLEAERAAKVV